MIGRKFWKPRGPWQTFTVLAAGYLAFFGGRLLWERSDRGVVLETGKPGYLRYELVDVKLSTNDSALKARWREKAPEVVVRREGREVRTVAGIQRFLLKEIGGTWTAKWPVPWNAEPGEYELAAIGLDDLKDRLQIKNFKIMRRTPAALPRGLSVLTLESVAPLALMQVKAPDGTLKDWTGLLDWAQYIGADAFWMLGGQSPGLQPGEPWVTTNLDMIPKVAAECRKRGLKFGVYAMCYLTMSKEPLPGYEYARDAADGHTVPTRAISLRDAKRERDIAALLKGWAQIPGVDFIGLDYIRNALGGYELAEDFFAEMPGVIPPANWAALSSEERMVWLARKKIMRRDPQFIDAWQWWRAHKVGQIVSRIKKEVGSEKALWAFSLTCDKGWHHGQDPVMMNDAGVDADALMMYEADREQYDAIIRSWHAYVRRGDVQLVVGDVVDWPLHQRDAAGPKELYRRTVQAVDGVFADGPAHGVFFHDISRALTGRTGVWGTRGWMDEARRATTYLKGVAP